MKVKILGKLSKMHNIQKKTDTTKDSRSQSCK